MYWAFKVLTRSRNRSADRVEAIAAALCLGCHQTGPGLAMHGSIPHDWYGANMCKYALPVDNLTDLNAFVEVGDVLIIGEPRAPTHSMVVVETDGPGGRISIRGFNNTGTFNAGPRDAYDNVDRDITQANLWHPGPGGTHFGQAYGMGGKMHRLQFGTYVHSNAQALMHKFKRTGGVMSFAL